MDAHGALVQIPYVKGALFLSQLRTEFGEENFGEESRFTPPGMRAAYSMYRISNTLWKRLVAAISRPHSIGESMTEPITKTKRR